MGWRHGRQIKSEVSKNTDNARRVHTRSGKEWEIKKGVIQIQQINRQMGAVNSQWHLTVKSSNSTLDHSSIPVSRLCLHIPTGAHSNPSWVCQASFYPFSPSTLLSILPSSSWDLISPSQSSGPALMLSIRA